MENGWELFEYYSSLSKREGLPIDYLMYQASIDLLSVRWKAIIRKTSRLIWGRRGIARDESSPSYAGPCGIGEIGIETIVGLIDNMGEVKALPILGKRYRGAWMHSYYNMDPDDYAPLPVRRGVDGWLLDGDAALLLRLEFLRCMKRTSVRVMRLGTAMLRRGIPAIVLLETNERACRERTSAISS